MLQVWHWWQQNILHIRCLCILLCWWQILGAWSTDENIYGFHLCIHYRDFPVGGSIFDTIIERMSASKVILLVISDLSISSRMCQFEIEEAQKHALNEGKQLLLIKLGAITKTTADSTVAFLLDRHTYLEWHEDSKSHKLFWAKLVGHLYDDFHGSSSRCCCPYGTRALGYEELQWECAELRLELSWIFGIVWMVYNSVHLFFKHLVYFCVNICCFSNVLVWHLKMLCILYISEGFAIISKNNNGLDVLWNMNIHYEWSRLLSYSHGCFNLISKQWPPLSKVWVL